VKLNHFIHLLTLLQEYNRIQRLSNAKYAILIHFNNLQVCCPLDDYPEFPSGAQMNAYLRSYAKHYDLYKHIQFNTKVNFIRTIGCNMLITCNSVKESDLLKKKRKKMKTKARNYGKSSYEVTIRKKEESTRYGPHYGYLNTATPFGAWKFIEISVGSHYCQWTSLGHETTYLSWYLSLSSFNTFAKMINTFLLIITFVEFQIELQNTCAFLSLDTGQDRRHFQGQ
jgi:hypothetical protein